MAGKRIVRPGECLSSIAFETGFFALTLWEHPENAALKAKRLSPYVLLPGDEVFVPELEAKSLARATGVTHVFRRKGVPARLRLRLLDKGVPRVNVPYAVEFDDGTRVEGATNDEGALLVFITPSARNATLVLKAGSIGEQRFALDIGSVTPTSSDDGVAGRLVNLGYLEEQAAADPLAAANALEAFQRAKKLDATGTLDATTDEKLREHHGD